MSLACLSNNLKPNCVGNRDFGVKTGKLPTNGCINMAAMGKKGCQLKMNGFRRSVESHGDSTVNNRTDEGYIRKASPSNDDTGYVGSSRNSQGTENGNLQTSMDKCKGPSMDPDKGYRRPSDEDDTVNSPANDEDAVTFVECSAVTITTIDGSDAIINCNKPVESLDMVLQGGSREVANIPISEVKVINTEPVTEPQLDSIGSDDDPVVSPGSNIETCAHQWNILDTGDEGQVVKNCINTLDVEVCTDSDNSNTGVDVNVVPETERQARDSDTVSEDTALNNLNRENVTTRRSDTLTERAQDGEASPDVSSLTIEISTLAIQVESPQDKEEDDNQGEDAQKTEPPKENKKDALDSSKDSASAPNKKYCVEEALVKKMTKINKFLSQRGKRLIAHGPEKGYAPDMVRFQPYDMHSASLSRRTLPAGATNNQPLQAGFNNMTQQAEGSVSFQPQGNVNRTNAALYPADLPEISGEDVAQQLHVPIYTPSPAPSPMPQESNILTLMSSFMPTEDLNEMPTSSSSSLFINEQLGCNQPPVTYFSGAPITCVASSTGYSTTPAMSCYTSSASGVHVPPVNTFMQSAGFLPPAERQQQPKQPSKTTTVGNSVGTVTEYPQPSTVIPIIFDRQSQNAPPTSSSVTTPPTQQPGSPFDDVQASPYSQSSGSICPSPYSASGESSQGSPCGSDMHLPSPAPSTPASHTTQHSDRGYGTSSPDLTPDADAFIASPPPQQMQQPAQFPNQTVLHTIPVQQHQQRLQQQQQPMQYPATQPNYQPYLTTQSEIVIHGQRYRLVTEPNQPPPPLQHMSVTPHNVNDWPQRTSTQYMRSPSVEMQAYPVQFNNGGEVWQRVQAAPLSQVCSKDEDGDTSLHIAIAQGEKSLCMALIYRLSNDSKADLDAQDNHGQTPLHIAVLTHSLPIIDNLIMKGANVSKCNHAGSSILHCAAERGFSQAIYTIGNAITQYNATVQPPLERISLDMDFKDSEGLTPLHVAVNTHGTMKRVFIGEQLSDITVDNRETIELLCRMSASPAYQDGKAGKTALHYAAERGNIEIMELLLSKVAVPSELVNTPMFNGNTALHLVVGSNRSEKAILELVAVLFRHGADPGIQNSEGEKAIMYTKQGHSQVKRKLKIGQ